MLRNVMIIFMLPAFLLGCSSHAPVTSAPKKESPTPVRIQATNMSVTPQTSPLSITDTAPPDAWAVMDASPSMNQIRTLLVDRSSDLWAGGPGGIVHWDLDTGKPTIYAWHADPESTNVIALSQTPDNAIWAGTFGNGLARFDGESWESFTIADGVPDNYIVAQTVTSRGELWFAAQSDRNRSAIEKSHFVHFDGAGWITEKGIAFDHLVTLLDDSIVGVYNEPPIGGMYFNSQIGIFDGRNWNGLDVYPGEWVDAITVAPNGVIWFATLDAVYRYEDQTWEEITPPWAGKDFSRVSSIAVSKDGLAWFGFAQRAVFDIDRCGDEPYLEEQGVYRYDGKTWTHFTIEDGLVDNKVCAVALDADGNAWFGSFDKGVSRFDGRTWKNYVIP